jgi:hypothetical protein
VERRLDDGPCAVTWCAETGIHDLHQAVLATWLGLAPKGENRGVTAQAIVEGRDEASPRLTLLLVDSLVPTRPIACELSWEQVAAAGWTLVDAASRWRD